MIPLRSASSRHNCAITHHPSLTLTVACCLPILPLTPKISKHYSARKYDPQAPVFKQDLPGDLYAFRAKSVSSLGNYLLLAPPRGCLSALARKAKANHSTRGFQIHIAQRRRLPRFLFRVSHVLGCEYTLDVDVKETLSTRLFILFYRCHIRFLEGH
jgi:hypothetical protein